MKTPKTFLLLSVVVAVLILGVAYAAIQDVTLEISGNATASPEQANFKVHFAKTVSGDSTTYTNPNVTTGAEFIAENGLKVTADNKATIEIEGMTKVGDTVVVVFTVENTSDDIAATLASDSTNTNTNYFSVEEVLSSNDLAADGGSATLTLTVTCIKTPVQADQKATIGATIIASPDANQ